MSYKTVNARDLLALSGSLALFPAWQTWWQNCPWQAAAGLGDYRELCELVGRAIHPNPPSAFGKAISFGQDIPKSWMTPGPGCRQTPDRKAKRLCGTRRESSP